VLSKRAPDLELALELPRGELKFLPYASPDKVTTEESDVVCVGAKAKTSNAAELLWAYLYWVLKEAPKSSEPSATDGQKFQLGVQFEVWPEDKNGKFVNALEIAVDKPPFGADDWWWFTRDEGFYMELNSLDEICAFDSKLDVLIEKATAVIKAITEAFARTPRLKDRRNHQRILAQDCIPRPRGHYRRAVHRCLGQLLPPGTGPCHRCASTPTMALALPYKLMDGRLVRAWRDAVQVEPILQEPLGEPSVLDGVREPKPLLAGIRNHQVMERCDR
jgi:hypothetical protein